MTLDAQPGTTTHIISPTTTDASTLLGLLVGLYPPDQGTVTLDGSSLEELSLNATRSTVALVLQDPWIMDGTVADNIAFGDPTVSRGRIERVVKLLGIDEIIASFPDGLDNRTGKSGLELTVGERRLVALARALLRDPSVLLLEDPMRDLNAREATRAIKAINRARRDRTTIITAQQFDGSMFSTDQVLYLREGRIEEADLDTALTHGLDDDSTQWQTDSACDQPSPTEGVPPNAGSSADIGEPGWSNHVGQKVASGYTAVGLLHRWERTETWMAWHGPSSQVVELKLPRQHPVTSSAEAELRNEHARATHLQHPGLARPLEGQFSIPLPFAAYERVDGHLLSHVIGARLATLEPLEIAAIGADLARTLTYLHRLNHAHLDLSPMVVKHTPEGTVIVDLKHALPIGDERRRYYDLHRRGAIAPEQLQGEPAAAAMDVYALGALLHQAATGQLVSTANPPDLTKLGPEVPNELGAVMAEMLAPEPNDRPTAREALNQIRPLLDLPPSQRS